MLLPLAHKSVMKKSVAELQKDAQSAFDTLKYPLVAYSLMACLTVYSFGGWKWSWFSYHPMSMLLGFVALAGNATLIKKIGGKDNTNLHGYLMSVATVLAGFGFYVIYSNKNKMHKPHFTSLHGKLGLVIMAGYTGLALFGAIALRPDTGIFRTNNMLRSAHKYAGKAMTALAWVSCVLGVMRMGKSEEYWTLATFSVPLLIFGLYVLL